KIKRGRSEREYEAGKGNIVRRGRAGISNANLTAGNSKEGSGKERPEVLQPLPVDRRESPAGLLARHSQEGRLRGGRNQRAGVRGEPDREHQGSRGPA